MARTTGETFSQKRANWSEDSLKQAMKAVKEGMSANRASVVYNIPRRTLRNHLVSGSDVRKLGRSGYLSREQEAELACRIIRVADAGMPITAKLVKRSVYTFCTLNDLPHPFSAGKGMAGRKWFKAFMERHPEIAERKAQTPNPKSIKLNKWVIDEHFMRLRHVMIDSEVMTNPQSIFNMNEKCCRLTLYHAPDEKKVAKNFVAPEYGENVTIVACANALGQAIPPMMLFKGLTPEWTENLPPGSVPHISPKGCLTTLAFIEWLKHFAKYKPAGKALLIFDGAAFNLDANIVDVADKIGVVLYCLPSNTAHALQPMDQFVFKSFESSWDDAVLAYWDNNPDRRISNTTVGVLFSKVWPKAVTPANVASGFRMTGIYPFDPSAIPTQLFAPGEITEREESAVEAQPDAITDEQFVRQVLDGEDSQDDDASESASESPVTAVRPAQGSSTANVSTAEEH